MFKIFFWYNAIMTDKFSRIFSHIVLNINNLLLISSSNQAGNMIQHEKPTLKESQSSVLI